MICSNFAVQSQYSSENLTLFRHKYLIPLAIDLGAKIKNTTPDSCDMIFPNRDALMAFEALRKSYTEKIILEEKIRDE